MPATNDETNTGDDRTTRSRLAGISPGDPTTGPRRVLRRYGPLAAVAVLAVGALVVFGRGSDGGDGEGEGEASPTGAAATRSELVRSGPMTPEKAQLTNASVDFGPTCDVNLGRITLPLVYAPPCVEPFTGDNGGAISPGVTADTVKLVVYFQDLGALAGNAVEGTGVDLATAPQRETIDRLVELYGKVFETYGRTVEVEYYNATGTVDDSAVAKADAIAIAERKPFAVIGGPSQASPAFADELAAREILCMEGCAVGLPTSFLEDHAPYVWQGQSQNGGEIWGNALIEAVTKLAGPGKATMAGSADIRAKERVYGSVHYVTPDGLQAETYADFRDRLTDKGIDLETDVEYELDTSRVQETARTIVTRLKQAGVTTVIFQGDPLTPKSLTEEATAQGYFPEWILGPNYLVETNQFARTYDPQQWGHGFAVVVRGVPAAQGLAPWDQIYRWAFGTDAPSDVAGTLEPPLRMLFTGIHLAGPELTAEAFRDGLLRYPPSGGGPTRPTIDWVDGGDVTLVWWDPEAHGVDETGAEGTGMYRFAHGGQRYRPGEIPPDPEAAGLLDPESSVITYDELPTQDQTPDYAPPT